MFSKCVVLQIMAPLYLLLVLTILFLSFIIINFSKNDLIASLYDNFNSTVLPRIFSNNPGSNPYNPTNGQQFELPLGIDPTTALDKHGQILDSAPFLDILYDYVTLIEGSGIDNSSGTPKFTPDLKKLLVDEYVASEDLKKRLKFYEDCEDDDDDDRATFCKDMVDAIEELLKKQSDQGFNRFQLDFSIAYIFGNGTSPGQVRQQAGTKKFCIIEWPLTNISVYIPL